MKVIGRLLLLVVVLVLVGGVVFYERPVWVGMQQTHLGLFRAHVQSNYVMTPAGRVHYYEAEADVPGGGIPLVLLHGLADRSESWAPMLKRLKADGFHVYAPDLLGYGRSPKPVNSDYSITTEEQFAADFMQALGLQKVDVGGWSMGAWVALKLALDKPEMVDRVVVYAGTGVRYPGDLESATVFRPSTGDDVNRLLQALEPGARPLPEYVAKDALRRLQEGQWVTDKSMASMATGKDLLDARLPGLTQPLLLVWGSRDVLVPLVAAETMQGMVPSAELDVMEGCGHLAPKYCADRVAGATADFLKAHPAPGRGVKMVGPVQ